MNSQSGEIERIAAACRPVAEAEPRLLGLYLFGSRTDGTAHERSDVDLGALFRERVGLGEVVGLEARFEDALRTSVDLIDIGHSDPFLALDAIRGERIYEADGVACDEFDLYVMRRAGDLAPFEHERRRMVLTPSGARR